MEGLELMISILALQQSVRMYVCVIRHLQSDILFSTGIFSKAKYNSRIRLEKKNSCQDKYINL